MNDSSDLYHIPTNHNDTPEVILSSCIEVRREKG